MAHCRLRPRHPLHVYSLGARNQCDATGALACARRRNDVTCSNGIGMPPYSPLCANMTSSIKPEVRNASRRRRKEGRAAAMRDMHIKFGDDWECSFGDMLAERQKQTRTTGGVHAQQQIQRERSISLRRLRRHRQRNGLPSSTRPDVNVKVISAHRRRSVNDGGKSDHAMKNTTLEVDEIGAQISEKADRSYVMLSIVKRKCCSRF